MAHFKRREQGSCLKFAIVLVQEMQNILRDILEKEVPTSNVIHLIKRKNLNLSEDQDILIQKCAQYGYQYFDVMLLYKLIRYLCTSIQPPTKGWGANTMPKETEITVGDDVERIRLLRNKIFGEISKSDIDEYIHMLLGICERMESISNQKYVSIMLMALHRVQRELWLKADPEFEDFLKCLLEMKSGTTDLKRRIETSEMKMMQLLYEKEEKITISGSTPPKFNIGKTILDELKQKVGDTNETIDRLIEFFKDYTKGSLKQEDTITTKTYPVSNFPHWCYISGLIQECASRVTAVTSIPDFKYGNTSLITVLVGGDLTKLAIVSLSNGCKEIAYQTSEKPYDTSLLVYFQRQHQNLDYLLTEIKSMIPVPKHTILVLNEDSDFNFKSSVESGIEILPRNKERVRDAITEYIEKPFLQYLMKMKSALKSELDKGRTSFKHDDLIEEINAVMKMVKNSQGHFDSSTGRTVVSSTITEFLNREPDVRAFGLWKTGEFKIFVTKNTAIESIRKALLELDKKFFNTFKLVFSDEDVKDGIRQYVGQGDKIFRSTECSVEQGTPLLDSLNLSSFATLGGFAVNSENLDQLFAMTNNHFYRRVNEKAFALSKIENKPRVIGKCVFTNPTGKTMCDFALVQIEETSKEECDTIFKDEKGNKAKPILFEGNIHRDIQIVHKRGATTKATTGRVAVSEFHDLYKGRGDVFHVKNMGNSFSEQGDSGSLVFAHDMTSDQKSLYVVGMIIGNDSDATVCFRLDEAFNIVKDDLKMQIQLYENSEELCDKGESETTDTN